MLISKNVRIRDIDGDWRGLMGVVFLDGCFILAFDDGGCLRFEEERCTVVECRKMKLKPQFA